jgi:hypothetical protein
MLLPNYNAQALEEHQIAVNHTLGDPSTYYTATDRDREKRQAWDKGLFSTNTQMTVGGGGEAPSSI